MKKVTEYELLKDAVDGTIKIAAKVLDIPEVEALRMSAIEKARLIHLALPHMTPEQKKEMERLNEAPRKY